MHASHPETADSSATADTGVAARLGALLSAHRLRAVLAVLGATLLLGIPLIAMQPTSTASPEPSGPAFDARDAIDERLAPDVFTPFFIVEARDGNLLTADALRELRANSEALRTDPELAPLLLEAFDRDLGREVDALLTLADLVEERLAARGESLATADDAVVAAVGSAIVDEVGPVTLGLSVRSARADDGTWTVPAQSFVVLADNEALGGGATAVIGTDDTTKEEFARAVRATLRGDEASFEVHSVAIDANLTAADQGAAAAPFIGLTVVAVLLLVGAVHRSAWAVAVTGVALAGLIVWLLGLSNLVGLSDDQILAVIVPIALISFGIDFAFHAIGRYREEREAGRPPAPALRLGIAGVVGALALALASDASAFLANTTSGIESIVQFGIASALGLLAAFVLLGLTAPTLLSWIEDHVASSRAGHRATAGRVAGAVAAAFGAMNAILVTVYVDVVIGFAIFVAYTLLALVVPIAWRRRRADRVPGVAGSGAPSTTLPDLHDSAVARRLTAFMVAVARRRAVVLPLVAVVTLVALLGALRVPTEFDVKDFFAQDTDFVVGLDELEEHVGDTGGEPANVVVEGDLADPAVVARLATFEQDLRALDTERFATDDDGEVAVDGGVTAVLRSAVAVEAFAPVVAGATGVRLTDADGDGLPDTREQVEAALAVALERGIARGDGTVVRTPGQVATAYDPAGDGAPLAITQYGLQMPGSRAVENITAAVDDVAPLLADLQSDLRELDPEARVTFTGSPVVRQESLDAASRALLLSLPVAILLCLLVAGVFLGSLRLALVAIVPILLVVPWLYGFMWATGHAINLVTGTIGAISIGIGIDFAIHVVARFDEELGRRGDAIAALRATAGGTGVALLASATSSVIGFALLAFAPMPLFASFGLLTAVMIVMALVATLLVLPPLLLVAAPDEPAGRGGPTPAPPRADRPEVIRIVRPVGR